MKRSMIVIAVTLAGLLGCGPREHGLSPEVRAAVIAILPDNPPIRITCETSNFDCNTPGHPFMLSFESGENTEAYLRAAHLARFALNRMPWL